jgi:hypothetical protein
MMTHVGFWEGIARDLTGRGLLGGRFQIRLILQPLVAMLLGARFGVRDAKHGKRTFFLSVVSGGRERWAILRQGLRDAIVPLCVALVLDGVLQELILGRVRPGAAVVVGLLLVFLPFVLLRGLANRIWTHGHHAPVPHTP